VYIRAQQRPASAYRIDTAAHIDSPGENCGFGYPAKQWKFEGGRGIGAESELEKKKEFTGIMLNMLPGNSFPQICVVSETDYR
jgi:hypothetical protein